MTALATIAMGLGFSTVALAQADAEKAPASPPPASAQPAKPAPAEASAPSEYVVAAGDTLSSIAKKVTGDESNWKQIARENGIEDPGKLQVGQRLRIPSA